ncbi:MAG: AzlC family ABC transporter permease [Aquabacterium sp.]
MPDAQLPRPAGHDAPLHAHPEFRRGAREMVPMGYAVATWGLVTGVAMVQSGLAVWQAVLMSLVAFAGTAQLATLPLIASGAPVSLVLMAAACVNLRFVFLGLQWRPYFGHLPLKRRAALAYFCADLNLVLFRRRFSQAQPAPEQWPYFWGGIAVNASAWHLASLLGIALAHRIPLSWGLGFAGTISLLAFVWSMIETRRMAVAAAIAAAVSLAAVALPLKLNIVVAIVAAVIAGAIMDMASGRRQAGAAP